MAPDTSLRNGLLAVLPVDLHPQVDKIVDLVQGQVGRTPQHVGLAGSGDIRQIQIDEAHFVSFNSAVINGNVEIGEVIRGNKTTNIVVNVPAMPDRQPAYEEPPEPVELFGRDKELCDGKALLRRQGFLVLGGAPGCGKTALATRLAHDLAGDRKQILWCTLLLRSGFNTLAGRIAGFLGARENWAVYDQWREQLDKPSKQAATGALIDLIEQQLRDSGLVVCISREEKTGGDQPGADRGPLIALVDRLRQLAEQGHIVLIVAAQDPPLSILPSEMFVVGGIDEAAIGEILAAAGLERGRAAEIYRRTEGNPLFVRLAISAYAARGAEGWDLSQLPEDGDVRAELAQRMYDGLDRDERKVMQAVALLGGEPASSDAISWMARARDTQKVLDQLALRGLLAPAGTARGGGSYTQHWIIRAYCAAHTDLPLRIDYLARAASYYEQYGDDGFRAAIYYERAGKLDRAARLAAAEVWPAILRGRSRDAAALLGSIAARGKGVKKALLPAVALAQGRVAWALSAFDEARDHFLRAYQAYKELPQSLERRLGMAQAAARLARCFARELKADAISWVERGVAALGEPEGPGPREMLALLYVMQAQYLARTGERDKAGLAVERALAMAPADAAAVRIDAAIELIYIHCEEGRFGDAIREAEEAIRLCDQLDDRLRKIDLLELLATALCQIGQWDEALKVFDRALGLAREASPVEFQLSLGINLGLLRINAGEYECAEAELTAALALAEEYGFEDYRIDCLTGLADLAVRRGENEAARALIVRGKAAVDSSGLAPMRGCELDYLAALLALAAGETAQALDLTDKAVARAYELDLDIQAGCALRVRGCVLHAAGDRPEALAAFRESAELLAADLYEHGRTLAAWAVARGGAADAEGRRMLEDALAVFEGLGAAVDRDDARHLLGRDKLGGTA